MARVNRHLPPPEPSRFRPALVGTVCCILSALGYTAASICMRQLGALECDEMWAICNKELVTVVVVGPWILYRAFRGHRVLPPRRALVALIVVGFLVQVAGNLSNQWALGIVGLAVTVPVMFGAMLTASAIMGRVFLGEPVSRRSMFAIGLLLLSLGLLGYGAASAGKGNSSETDVPSVVLLACVGAAALAGTMYSLLTITIRRSVTGTTPLSAVVFLITAMGVISLGPTSVYRLGTSALIETPAEQWQLMITAGFLNLFAFLAITKGLQLTTAVHANLLNASQVAMATVAGLTLFAERPNPWLVIGVSLTVVGIISTDRPKDVDRDADQHA